MYLAFSVTYVGCLYIRHFLVTFFCCRKKVTGCRATPDELELKTQKKTPPYITNTTNLSLSDPSPKTKKSGKLTAADNQPNNRTRTPTL